MNNLYLLLLVPIFGAIIGMLIWKHSITVIEFSLGILIACLLTSGTYYASVYSNMADVQILNGHVVSKVKERVSCSHSYSCNCQTIRTGKTTDTRCDTCYEHHNDWDWDVKTTLGSFSVDRIDRRGSNEPSRWTQVVIGEPVAKEESYTNYIKGAPNSVFNKSQMTYMNKYSPMIPPYPEVYDYHRANRVLVHGTPIQDIKAWNTRLSEELKVLGPKKQANVVLLFTKETNIWYAEAVNAKWLGGKKNDIVIVVSSADGKKIEWVRVLSLTNTTRIKTYLRDELMNGEIDRERFMTAISKNVLAYYDRKSMEQFKYLLSSAELSPLATGVIAILSFLISLGLSYCFALPGFDLSLSALFRRKAAPTSRFTSYRR